MCCAADKHNNMCHICAKELLDSNFNKAFIYKISNLMKLLEIYIYTKIVIFQV